MKRRKIIFRAAPFNRLSFPILLNAWESSGIDRYFEIIVRETPLTEKPAQTIGKNDVVLFSFMTPHLPLVHREIEAVKETGALIAGGGPHIGGEQRLAFDTGFHVLFVGPGEKNFITFGTDLLENRIQRKEKKIYTDTGDTADEFNRYLPLTKYMKLIPPLEIMRGCFWNCAYCTTGDGCGGRGGRPLYRSLDSIKNFLDEISHRQFGRINYICPSSMEYRASKGRKVNLDKIEELLRLTHSYGFPHIEYGIFPSEIRPDTVSEAGMRMLKKYVSHKAVTLGAQSGSDERLKRLKRAHNTADIERAAAAANAAGFLANLDFITAYPDETADERRQTLEFIKTVNKKYRVRAQLHYFFPLSGSAYAHRFPSFLSGEEKEELKELKKGGLARDGWVENEKQVKHYFSWLKENFPRYYAEYSFSS
ncbi:MAG: TIGR04013 family B12-binding domain/radical SAM domain-containing protein [bacterium]|nr:TIGR04013 family B12-binding domain/radical SAM domain-containing protein [bacterium]